MTGMNISSLKVRLSRGLNNSCINITGIYIGMTRVSSLVPAVYTLRPQTHHRCLCDAIKVNISSVINSISICIGSIKVGRLSWQDLHNRGKL